MLPPGLSVLWMHPVNARTGLSPDAIQDRVGRGAFPTSAQLGPSYLVWRSDEVDAWIEAELERVGRAEPARSPTEQEE